MDPGLLSALAQLLFQGGQALFGGDKMKKFDQYTPEQNDQLKNVFQQLQGLQGGGYGNAMGLLQQYLDPNSDVYKNF